MKLIHQPNPLRTIIELDRHERRDLWHKIRFSAVADVLNTVSYHLDLRQLKKARAALDMTYFYASEYDDSPSRLDAQADTHLANCLKALKGGHVGECIQIECSCFKCHGERLTGVNTLAGLTPAAAHLIDRAFEGERDLGQVLGHLRRAKPDAGQWTAPDLKAAAAAHEWLTAYHLQHFAKVRIKQPAAKRRPAAPIAAKVRAAQRARPARVATRARAG